MSFKPRNFREWCNHTIPVLPQVYGDELSYYELLNKVIERLNEIGVTINELIDYVNHYFDSLDVQNMINKKLDEMAQDGTLESLIMPVYTYDLTKLKSFDVNDISAVFSELKTKMKDGESALLPYGKYTTLDTIDLSWLPNNTKVTLDGEITISKNNVPCVKLGGQFCNVKINALYGATRSETHLATGSGLYISELLAYSNVLINNMRFFENGIIFKYEDDNKYSQYNRFVFSYLENVQRGIVLDGTEHKGWVNENTFVGGRIKGGYGVVMQGGTVETVGFDNNKFYNIGFEELYNDAINITGESYANTFDNCRLIENIKGYYIYDHSSKGGFNKYNFSHIIQYAKISLSNQVYKEVNAPISDDNFSVVGGGVFSSVSSSKPVIIPLVTNDLISKVDYSFSMKVPVTGQTVQITRGFELPTGYTFLSGSITGLSSSDGFDYRNVTINFHAINESDGTYEIYANSKLAYEITVNVVVTFLFKYDRKL
jgi:hypothetical protein|nr:MAG TPA: hypothetical protein [Caudoviricetes sp.]